MIDDFKPEGTPVEGDRIAPQTILPIEPVADESQQPQFDQAQQQQAESDASQRRSVEFKDTEQVMRFREMRDAALAAQRERDEALRRLREYERKPAPEPELDIDIINVKDDELVEGKHIKLMKDEIKRLRSEQRQFQKQSYESTAEARIRSQYQDFDKVATIHNLQKLSEKFPEVAKSINATTDLYDKAVAAYQLIKTLGINEEEPFAAEKQQAIYNAQKPKPLASINPQQGETPLSRANAFAGNNYKLTPDMKDALRKEMEEASKRY